ncbi:MAG: alpha-(1-_3)-arabinofuranosyltransferase domain-containing protein [Ilumatobacteraceae bacterium]
MTRRGYFDRGVRTSRLWPTGLLYGALALAATLFDRPIDYVADNRFEQYFNPARGLAKMFAIWDGSRGLGGPREDVWLGTTIPTALLRGLGLPPAWSERVWHAGLLTLVGLGIVALLRVVRPRIGTAHVLAGLLVMFGPYTASFLLPSNLYVMFALSPWLLLVFVRGITGHDPWKWAAAFALIVLAAGNSDTPGLLYVVVMMVPTALYVVLVERVSTWRRVVGWSVRAGALAIATTAWILTKTYYASEALDARLADTELPSASATSSSWSESFRGVGNWLSYFREEGRLLKPQTVPFFEQPLIVLATFLLPMIALVAFWRSGRRHRLWFGALMLAGLAMMVGGFQAATASPLSDGILWLLEHSNTLLAFRNTYKAAAGLVIGVAVLAAIGMAAVWHRARGRSRWQRGAVLAAGVALLAATAQPFVIGEMYHPFERSGPVPSYWSDAFRYLNSLDSDGRSLIVPAVSQAQYRWGYVGDDIFDALLTRPHATATGWMLSTRTGHNALETITLWAQRPAYRPGVLGPMARRLGITEILVRNDLDWQRLNVARPSAFEGLRTDPDFELVASFGDPGLAVVSPFDDTDDAHAERSLPPVEVYRLRERAPVVETLSSSNGTIVATGDAGAIPQLARAGLLPDGAQVIASAAADDATLAAALQGGAPIVVTDTGQRRVRTLLHHEPQLSPVLSPDEELDRPVRPVHPDQPGGESVTWYRDATSITGAFTRLGGNRNDLRAANAFDGDLATAWAVPWSGLGPRPNLEVTLRQPTTISHVSIRSTITPVGLPTVAAAVLITDSGTEIPIRTDEHGLGDVTFPATTVRSFKVAPTDITLFGAEVGLTEVRVDGLDLTPHVQVPDDLTSRSPAVERLVADAPTAYTFRRIDRAVTATRASLDSTRYDEEVTIRRRFGVSHADTVRVDGDLRLLEATSDTSIDALIGGPLRASSARPEGASNLGHAAFLIDDDTTTSWSGPALRGMSATAHVERQAVDLVRVIVPSNRSTARLSLVDVTVGDRTERLTFSGPQCTHAVPRVCTRVASVVLDRPVETDAVTVTAIRFAKRNAFDRGSIRISEIVVGGDRVNHYEADAPLDERCADHGLAVGPDGAPIAVPVRASGTVGALLAGQPVQFTGCAPVELTAGTWQLHTAPATAFDRIAMVPQTGLRTPEPPAVSGDSWRQVSSDHYRSTVAAGDHMVTLRSSYDPRWVLHVAGKDIPATESDAGNVWRFTTAGPADVELRYSGAVPLRWSLLVSLLATLACVWLALRRTPASDGSPLTDVMVERPRAHRGPTRRSDTVALVVATVAGILLIGPWAIIIGAALWVLLRQLPSARIAVGVAPPMLLALAAIWSVATGWNDAVNIGYASQRLGPSALAALAAVFLFQALALESVAARATTAHVPSTAPLIDVQGVRDRWSHHRARRGTILGVVAVAAAVGILLAIAGRSALPETLLDNVRTGSEYTLSRMHGPAATSVAPLPVLVAAWSPLGVGATMFVFGVAFVIGSVVAARRLHSRARRSDGTVVVAVVAALFAAALLRELAPLCTAAALVWAVALAASPRIDVRRGLVVGALVAAAALSTPWALVAAVPIVGWWARRHVGRSAVAAALITTIVLVAPWWNVVLTS